jgi:hypothetical protein
MMNPQIKVPSLPDAERAVLGALLLEPEQAQKRLRELPASLFLDDGHKAVLRAIRKLVERGESLDELVLKAHLERSKECDAKLKSTTYILELKDACPSADNFPYWLGELKDYASRREFLQLAQQATELAMDTSQDPETLAAQFADIGKRVIGRSATRKQWITLLSPSEARNYTPPEGSILVGDCHLVRGATCVIGGMAGVGKSRAATALAVAGATGKDWFGLPVHCRFKTLIIQAENGRFRLSREFADIAGEGLDDYVRISEPPPYGLAFDSDGFRTEILQHVEDWEPAVVVLDPLNQVAKGDKLNDIREALQWVMESLPVENKPAVVIVAHTRKPKQAERTQGRDLLNEVAGSHILGSVPRAVFVMQAASNDMEDDRVVWACAKNNDGQAGAPTAWHRRNGLFEPCPDFDWEAYSKPEGDARTGIKLADIERLFAGGERSMTRARAAEELGELTGFKRSACYDATDPDGRFGKHIIVEGDGLTWNPNPKTESE